MATMSLQFVIGTASQDHTGTLLELTTEWLRKDVKNEVFYLVPNHVKFETEVSVLEAMHQLPVYKEWDNMVSMRLQVFSFSRLAWYFMQHTKSYQKKQLSDSGKYMILRQVLIDIESTLVLFKQEINKPGFIHQLVEIFDELQEGNITSDDLLDSIKGISDGEEEIDSAVKLLDIQLIYRAYSEKLSELSCDGHDLLLELSEYLQTQSLDHVMFVVSGFSNFTAVEKQLIESLMAVSGELKISLVLDKAYVTRSPERFNLFYNTGLLYSELYQLARHKQVPVLHDKVAKPRANTNMTNLDEFWQSTQTLSPVKELQPTALSHVLLWETETAYSELVRIAKDVRMLVSGKGYRYKDIVILSRDLDTYKRMIEPIFNEHDIPYYINQEMEMKHHPLVEFMASLFAMKDRYYQYRDVMRFLRTELFAPSHAELSDLEEWKNSMTHLRQQMDYTENVVLAYGYSGYDWIKSEDWMYVQYQYNIDDESSDTNKTIQEMSNSIRRQIREFIPPLFESLETVTIGRDAVVILYQFLIDAGVEKQLLFMRDQELERGNLIKARNHEQTWQALMDLLDEYMELMGDAPFILDDFSQIIQSGLEGLTYSKVPTTLDQLVVTSLDMVHAKTHKVTYIIGASDQQIPKKIENKTLLSNENRELLSRTLTDDKFLKKDIISDSAREPFVFYLSLLSATDKVVISCPRGSDQAKDMKLSPYMTLLSNGLRLKIDTKEAIPDVKNSLDVSYFSTDVVLLSDLIRIKREVKDNKIDLPWLWQQLEKRVTLKLPVKSERVLASLTHQNIPETLRTQTIDTLYGETIHASVSKIENFYKCQYKYFLLYGLGLKERETFELSPAATGDFYHEALDIFFKELMKQQLELATVSKEQVMALADSVLKELLGEKKFAILSTTNRMLYIKYQLEQTIYRVSWSLKRQSERSNMSTIQTEVLFGEALQRVGLNSLDVDLPHQKKLKVRGKIDRIDKMTIEEDTYLAVIDYKSSKHNFDFVDAYYGLAMQMITYLDVALENAVTLVGQEAQPAGAFYMHVQNPVLTATEKLDDDAIEEDMLKSFKYDGLLVNDPKLLETLDKTIDLGVKSSVYPYEQLKKGTMKSSKFVSEDEIGWLIDNNRQKFKEAGQQIFEGSTKLNPAFKGQERLACGFCPFRSVCQFDVMLKENNYHRIEKMSKEQIMAFNKEEECNEDD